METNPVFLFNQLTISLVVLPPSYSVAYPLWKNFKVGYPLISCSLAILGLSVASTLAKTTGDLLLFKTSAALAYSGANFLQCPHQVA